jgi:hypothetical protein
MSGAITPSASIKANLVAIIESDSFRFLCSFVGVDIFFAT